MLKAKVVGFEFGPVKSVYVSKMIDLILLFHP